MGSHFSALLSFESFSCCLSLEIFFSLVLSVEEEGGRLFFDDEEEFGDFFFVDEVEAEGFNDLDDDNEDALFEKFTGEGGDFFFNDMLEEDIFDVLDFDNKDPECTGTGEDGAGDASLGFGLLFCSLSLGLPRSAMRFEMSRPGRSSSSSVNWRLDTVETSELTELLLGLRCINAGVQVFLLLSPFLSMSSATRFSMLFLLLLVADEDLESNSSGILEFSDLPSFFFGGLDDSFLELDFALLSFEEDLSCSDFDLLLEELFLLSNFLFFVEGLSPIATGSNARLLVDSPLSLSRPALSLDFFLWLDDPSFKEEPMSVVPCTSFPGLAFTLEP